MTPTRKIERQEWMADRDLQAVFALLQASDDPVPAVLCVGGCVRDTLMDRPVVDVDIATVHPPETVKARLAEAGITTLDIGIEHGTVVANFDAKQFQLTTLRLDVETDGRHATVAFTDDWAADASRRDFTMNAFYADLDGNVFDPLDGMADIEAKRVRFIGDPTERIEEDALRVMRFFRFGAQLNSFKLDEGGLAACRAHFDLLQGLPGERVRDELLKIVVAPNARLIFHHMEYLDFLIALFRDIEGHDFGYGFRFMVEIEEELGLSDPIRRLSLLVVDVEGARTLGEYLRLSAKDVDRMCAMIAAPPGMSPALYPHTRKIRLYKMGAGLWRDRVLRSWALELGKQFETEVDFHSVADDIAPDEDWLDLLRFPETWPVPVFPLQGADVIDAGVAEGPEIGRHLAAVENWWMIRDFRPDHAACVSKLRRRLRWYWLGRRLGFA